MSGGLLVIGAHPDDEVLLAGGVLAACAAAGVETGVVSLTHGENGPIADPSLATPETLASVREGELRAACAALGVDFTSCLEFRDGELPWADADEARGALAALLDEHDPHALITFGGDGLYWHPDHIAVHDLTHSAVAQAGDATRVIYESVWPIGAMTELTDAMAERGLPSGLWDLDPAAFGVDQTKDLLAIDVTPFLAAKLAAIRAHATQVGPEHAFSHIPEDLAERYLGT